MHFEAHFGQSAGVHDIASIEEECRAVHALEYPFHVEFFELIPFGKNRDRVRVFGR